MDGRRLNYFMYAFGAIEGGRRVASILPYNRATGAGKRPRSSIAVRILAIARIHDRDGGRPRWTRGPESTKRHANSSARRFRPSLNRSRRRKHMALVYGPLHQSHGGN